MSKKFIVFLLYQNNEKNDILELLKGNHCVVCEGSRLTRGKREFHKTINTKNTSLTLKKLGIHSNRPLSWITKNISIQWYLLCSYLVISALAIAIIINLCLRIDLKSIYFVIVFHRYDIGQSFTMNWNLIKHRYFACSEFPSSIFRKLANHSLHVKRNTIFLEFLRHKKSLLLLLFSPRTWIRNQSNSC